MNYQHSICLNQKSCYGCTVCMKACPTEAIRIRGGKSFILDDKCIDCGACVKACPNNSKYCHTDSLADLNQFPVKVALVSPVLFGQFDDLIKLGTALDAVKSLGFDWVMETAKGAEVYANCAKELLKARDGRVITSTCPAVLRLIQIEFPDLLEDIVPLKTPEEITAELAKEQLSRQLNVSPDQIGTFLITSCPAQMANRQNPLGIAQSSIDRVIPFIEVIGKLKKYVSAADGQSLLQPECTALGLQFFNAGGQSKALSPDNHLVVDGIWNVARALEQMENDKFPGLAFFEGLACQGGCVGGALTFENHFVARCRMDRLERECVIKASIPTTELSQWRYTEEIQEKDVMQLDADMGVALEKYNEIEEIRAELPGLDCGACGSPTCKALAEDIVKGEASEFDCIFIMRTKLNIANRETEGEKS